MKKNEGENLQWPEVYVSERQGETGQAKAPRTMNNNAVTIEVHP
jgi:hypothetical protein